MRQFRDKSRERRVCIEPSADEIPTIKFAVDVCLANTYLAPPSEPREGLAKALPLVYELADELKTNLTESETCIIVGPEAELALRSLRFVRYLHTNCPASNYWTVSRALNVRPFDLLMHGIAAGQMLEPHLRAV